MGREVTSKELVKAGRQQKHLKKPTVVKSRFQKPKREVRFLQEEGSSDQQVQEDTLEYPLFILDNSNPLKVTMMIDDKVVTLELDTGSGVTLMSEKKFNELWEYRQLQPSTVTLRTYTGENQGISRC